MKTAEKLKNTPFEGLGVLIFQSQKTTKTPSVLTENVTAFRYKQVRAYIDAPSVAKHIKSGEIMRTDFVYFMKNNTWRITEKTVQILSVLKRKKYPHIIVGVGTFEAHNIMPIGAPALESRNEIFNICKGQRTIKKPKKGGQALPYKKLHTGNYKF